LKIAYLCTDAGIPIFGSKGASIHIRETASALKKLDKEIFIVAVNKDGEVLPDFKVPVYQVSPFTSKKLGSDFRKILTNIKFYLKVKKIIEREKPQVLYERYELYGFAGILLAKKFSLPHILEINGPLLWGPKRRFKFPWLANLWEKKIFCSTQAIIVPTETLKEYVMPQGVAERKIFPNPLGASPEEFIPQAQDEELRNKLGLKDSTVVGFVGMLAPRQGLEVLVEAAKSLSPKMPELKYLIVGGGYKFPSLEEKIREYNLSEKFIFTGNVPHKKIPAYLNIMDITILPNMSKYSSPVKIFEYMAMAKPVIAPAKGQVKKILRDGHHGILIPPGAKNELEYAIVRLYEDEALREKLGQNARKEVIKNYTWAHHARRILDIYENLKTEDRII